MSCYSTLWIVTPARLRMHASLQHLTCPWNGRNISTYAEWLYAHNSQLVLLRLQACKLYWKLACGILKVLLLPVIAEMDGAGINKKNSQ